MKKLNVEIIGRKHALDILDVCADGGGWASSGMRLQCDKAAYYVKVFDKRRAVTPRLVQEIKRVVPALEWFVNAFSFEQRIPLPIRTADGELTIEDDTGVYMLYPYIAGGCIGLKGLNANEIQHLAAIIGTLHSCGPTIPGAEFLPVENFRPWFLEPLLKQLYEVDELSHPRVKECLLNNRSSLQTYAERLAVLGNAMCKLAPPLRLCHTDLHPWNWLRSADGLVLIDWEGLRLAPVEADMMFFVNKSYWPEFVTAYRRIHPDFVIDPERLWYYQVRRLLEDIWEFIEQILFDGLDAEAEATALQSLHKELHSLNTL